MAQYLVEDTDLNSIADAILEKTGGTNPLVFPGEFKEAISGISGGATEPYIEEIYDASGNLIEAKLYGHSKIRDYTFYNCTKLALASLPSGLKSIGSSAFHNCTNLALTSLPSSITSISNYAFYGCINLAITSLPSGITRISNYAFRNCTKLASLTFKGTPTSISNTAFFDCSNLTTINVPWAEGEVANAPWGATNATINYNYTEA